jgi:aspartate aminotransferase
MIDAVQNYYKKIGVPLEKGEIQITTAGSEALMMALSCILDNGDEIIIPEPFYTNYNTFVNLTGGSIRPIPCTPEEGYKFASREKIEPLINEHTRAIMFTNPGNPTGTVLTREEMELVCQIAKEHDLFVIGDEVYREFVYENEPLQSILQLEGLEENAIVIDSVSKRFSACGARIGCIISHNKEVMAAAMKLAQSRLCPPVLGQYATLGALDTPFSYFDEVKEEYIARRNCAIEALNQMPGVYTPMPMGAFYTVAELPVDDAEAFAKWLLTDFRVDNETVMVTPAKSFYKTEGVGHNHVRIAYVLEVPKLKKAMHILAEALKVYPGRTN